MVSPSFQVLITGSAGFVGFHLALRLLREGYEVTGVDNFNSYYSVELKEARAKQLREFPGYREVRLDLSDRAACAALFASLQRDGLAHVVHLAAQPGVRYSIENPSAYVDANLTAFGNVLEGVRATKPAHFVFASSSSVYGNNEKTPFSETDPVDQPVSFYAATKRANELMAYSYAHLYRLPTTALRFFTVYGPWGRPDMALFKFTRAILAGESIDVFNHGDLIRDYTYVDDIVAGIVATMTKPPMVKTAGEGAPYNLFNIGNHQPVKLLDFIAAIERATGKTANKRMLPMQPGDVYKTMADVSALCAWTGISPQTPVSEGVKAFVAWYRDYYKV